MLPQSSKTVQRNVGVIALLDTYVDAELIAVGWNLLAFIYLTEIKFKNTAVLISHINYSTARIVLMLNYY